MIERHPSSMRSPRQLLATIAVAMVVVASQTLRFPPEFLFLPYLWAGLAALAGAACAVTAIHPTRFLVATTGSLLVTVSSARALALSGEVFSGGFSGSEIEASFIIGATVWLVIAALVFVVWHELVVPWSIGSDQ